MKEKLSLVGAYGFGRVVLEHASQYYDCTFVDDGEATKVDGGRLLEISRTYLRYIRNTSSF